MFLRRILNGGATSTIIDNSDQEKGLSWMNKK